MIRNTDSRADEVDRILIVSTDARSAAWMDFFYKNGLHGRVVVDTRADKVIQALNLDGYALIIFDLRGKSAKPE